MVPELNVRRHGNSPDSDINSHDVASSARINSFWRSSAKYTPWTLLTEKTSIQLTKIRDSWRKGLQLHKMLEMLTLPPHRLQLHRLQVGDDGCTKFACGSVVNLDGSYRIGRGQRSNQPFAARLLDGSLPSSLLFLQSSSSWDKWVTVLFRVHLPGFISE